jgi:hypothetical protein
LQNECAYHTSDVDFDVSATAPETNRADCDGSDQKALDTGDEAVAEFNRGFKGVRGDELTVT